MRDLANHINPKPVIAPVVISDNTASVGAIIDRYGYESVTYLINTGTLADADATFVALLEESDASNMAGANAVAAKDLLGSAVLAGFDFSADGACRKLGYIGSKRYTRLTITPAANTGAAPISAMAVLGHGQFQPTAQTPN
jgi:hypothetical protein